MLHHFSVRPRDHEGPIHRIAESSPQAAAVAYLEAWPIEEGEEISIVVRDIETGHEHCFRLDDGAAMEGSCA